MSVDFGCSKTLVELEFRSEMNSVVVSNASKCFQSSDDKLVVLNNLSLTVQSGSIYTLIGASGCGKTTLLSCILGMQKLDDGYINVLGYEDRNEQIMQIGRKVGYMPQELALLGYLTVQETIYFFGNVCQMNKYQLYDRYEMLKNLFQLPRDTKLVGECSGGEKRRVSLVASMIHDPILLILDEPTVGLDPILRDVIWNYFVQITRNSHTTIIITTHYIDEAKFSDRCGLMRRGVLLAEDTPLKIMERFECDTLDEAFLKLCTKQSTSKENQNLQPIETDNFKSDEMFRLQSDKMEYFHKQTMSSLCKKIYIQTLRQPLGLVLVFVLPALQFLNFYYAIGGDPKGLKIGIVNGEILDYHQSCGNSSLTTTFLNEDRSCDLNSISCRFLEILTDDIAEKVFYENYSMAYEAAKKAKIIGIIEFSSNFTLAQSNFLLNDDKDDLTMDNKEIKITLDQTNFQSFVFLQRKFYEIFKNYSRNLMSDCNFQKKLNSFGVDFLEPVYGELEGEIKNSITPYVTILILFITASCTSGMTFLDERQSSMWSKSLLLGVRMSELMIAQIFIQSCYVSIQIIEAVICTKFLFSSHFQQNNWLIYIFYILISFDGLFFGMLTSCLFNNIIAVCLFLTGASISFAIVAGMIWPIEGMPMYLQYYAKSLPFSFPSQGLKDVIFKGYGIKNISVMLGILIPVLWAILLILLILVILKSRKFA